MKTRMISIILLCAIIVLSLPLSACADKTSFATDLENANNTPVSASTPTSQFVDVPQWATEAVAFVADREIMVGVGNNLFDPQSNITKKECAATLYLSLIHIQMCIRDRIILLRFKISRAACSNYDIRRQHQRLCYDLCTTSRWKCRYYRVSLYFRL